MLLFMSFRVIYVHNKRANDPENRRAKTMTRFERELSGSLGAF